MTRKSAQKRRINRNSVAFKLFLSLLPIIPLCILLVFNSIYAVQVTDEKVAAANRDALVVYGSEIDRELTGATQFLFNTAASDTDLKIMESARDESQYNMSKFGFWNRTLKLSDFYPLIESVFTYSTNRNDMLEIHFRGGDYAGRELMRGLVCRELVSGGGALRSSGWVAVQAGGKNYLVRTIPSGGLYLGAWLSIDGMLAPLKTIYSKEDSIAVYGRDGGLLGCIGPKDGVPAGMPPGSGASLQKGRQYAAAESMTVSGDIAFALFTPQKMILEELPLIQKIMLLVAIFVLLMIPLCIVMIRRSLFVPLEKVIATMDQVKGGDLEARIPPFANNLEFSLMQQTFNNMMDQLGELKIQVYENRIKLMRAETDRVQLQVNPHFFLNSLNLINSYALSRNYKLVLEMTQCLTGYFRFALRSNTQFVTLRDEIAQVDSYLNIQKLRYPNRLDYGISIPDELMDVSVPILVVHTFVENAVKYAMGANHVTVMSVRGSKPSGETVELVVEDNGPGFSPDVLCALQQGVAPGGAGGQHIGIVNLMERMELYYQGRSGITLENHENGARITIRFPAGFKGGNA